MNLRELHDILGVRPNGRLESKTIILDANILQDDAFERVIQSPFYNGQALTITDAELLPAASDEVKIGGRMALFADGSVLQSTVDHPVEAHFWLQDDGTLFVVLRFPLNVEWVFTDNFPNLPGIHDPNLEEDARYHPLTHYLETSGELHQPEYIFSNRDQVADPDSGVALKSGLNFVASWSPIGLLGVFEAISTANAPLRVYGAITMPSDETLPLLDDGVFPWHIEPPVPGINLQVDLVLSQSEMDG